MRLPQGAKMSRLASALALLAVVLVATSYADQVITEKQLVLKDPKPGVDPTERKLTLEAGERSSTDTVVGDPTTGGAMLKVTVVGFSSASQVFDLGAGIDPRATGPTGALRGLASSTGTGRARTGR